MPEDVKAILNEAYRRLNENTRRLRAMEERYDMIENRLETIQNTFLQNTKTIRMMFDKLSGHMRSMEDRLTKIENDTLKMSRTLEKTPRKSEMEELKTMVSLYSPFKKKGENK